MKPAIECVVNALAAGYPDAKCTPATKHAGENYNLHLCLWKYREENEE